MIKFINRVIFGVFMLLIFFHTFATNPLQAQVRNGIRLSNFEVYSAGSYVTFDISWSKEGRYEPWSDTVWVFMDHLVDEEMVRLEVAPGA